MKSGFNRRLYDPQALVVMDNGRISVKFPQYHFTAEVNGDKLIMVKEPINYKLTSIVHTESVLVSDFSGVNSTLTLLLSSLNPLELHNSRREGSNLQKNKQEALRLRDSTCFIRLEAEHIVKRFAVTPGGSEGSLISHVRRGAKVSFWVCISQSGWMCCAPNGEVTPTCFKMRNKI